MQPSFVPSHRSSKIGTITPVALAVLTCLAASVHAQEPPAQASTSELETVVITGIHSSNAKTIAAKRESAVTVDTIAADEIGKLPDFNVGDALKRVTGVNALTYQGEPRYVIVRSLNANYNITQIDGFSFATSDIGSRQVLMEMLPANFAQRIDATKSFLPESDGGAIGGVVNIVTGNAFALPDGSVSLSAKLGQNSMEDQYGGTRPAGEASAKWAKRFGEKKEFGLLTTASYWRRDINVPQAEAGGSLNWYNANGTRSTTPYSGNGYAVPTERRWYNYDNQREREGLTSRLDWMPEGPLTGHLSAYLFQQQETSNRSDLLAAVNAAGTVSNQSATSGTLSSVNQNAQLGRLRWDRKLYGTNGELNYEIEPGWTADLRASVSRATVDNPQIFDQFMQSGMPFNYTYNGSAPTFAAVSAANAANAALYLSTFHREEDTTYAENVYDVQANTRRNMEPDSQGLGLAAGARAMSTRGNTALARTNWNNLPYTLATVTSGGSICGFNCNTSIPLINPALLDAAFAANASTVKPAADVAGQYGATYDYREDITAAYAQGQYRKDKLLFVGGLRFEHTSFDTNGFLKASGVYSNVNNNSSYNNVLPSLLAVYDTTDTSKLRLGVSQTIGRPRYDQMATRGGSLTITGNTGSLSQGNAALKPRRSNNLDFGHDWYLDNGRGIFSVAAFYKEIHDEIFNYGQTEQMNVNGATIPVLVTQARNASGVVKLSGLEFGLTKDFTFLPAAFKGFGASANATFTQANYPVTLSDGSTKTLEELPQQAKEIWNIALYYEQGSVHGKLAWNHVGRLWDDRYPNYTPTGFYANRYQQATNNVDLQLAYDVSKQMSISVDVLNLTRQGMQYNYGNAQENLQSAWKLPLSVLVGMNYKF